MATSRQLYSARRSRWVHPNPLVATKPFRYTSQSTKAGDLAAERNCLVVQDEFYCGCGINDDLTDDGNQMMYEIVEEFAKSNQVFIDAFVPAFEKMISNGYDDADLTITVNSEGNPSDNWRFK